MSAQAVSSVAVAVICVALLEIPSVVAHAEAGHATATREAEAAIVSEVVFQRRIGRITKFNNPLIRFIFLAVEQKDPADSASADPAPEIIKKFAHHSPPVLPMSAAFKTHQGIFERTSCEPGILLRLGKIEWTSDTDARVTLIEWRHPIAGHQSRFVLQRQDGKWTIASEEEIVRF